MVRYYPYDVPRAGRIAMGEPPTVRGVSPAWGEAMRRRALTALLLAALLGGCWFDTRAGAVLDPKPAPEWEVSEWINGNPGPLSRVRNRVVLILFFQLWCPVSNEFAIPVFQRWQQKYGDRRDVYIVGIHSVFEGFEQQTPSRLRAYLQERGITFPVGIDSYDPREPRTPVTMRRFEAGGTPHLAIVDKNGDLRFSHFGRFDPGPVEAFIERLLREPPKGSDSTGPMVRVADPALSGTYRMTVEQSSITCGEPAPPFEVSLEVSVYDGQIEVRSDAAFLGVDTLTLNYEPMIGRIEARTLRRTTEQDVSVGLALDVRGWFNTLGPQFEVDFWLDKKSEQVGRDCNIKGRARGELVHR